MPIQIKFSIKMSCWYFMIPRPNASYAFVECYDFVQEKLSILGSFGIIIEVRSFLFTVRNHTVKEIWKSKFLFSEIYRVSVLQGHLNYILGKLCSILIKVTWNIYHDTKLHTNITYKFKRLTRSVCMYIIN